MLKQNMFRGFLDGVVIFWHHIHGNLVHLSGLTGQHASILLSPTPSGTPSAAAGGGGGTG
jgi:hypothetical protein